ncbi:hypothetical protein SAMN05660297_01561 [Natronincola peptidivorans]|uniref:S1 motif domain-containing protein n=1 Tax=Natronincola peptidivorans TaxID=426128 RepID=A0A1I0CAQ8_9FIRM|nr:S1-like domain-containing RNA-binding protein [Natronincola peptidivorans]SET16495.1 hypothetical protein SAMN05660297_01561 [Natronincola peptidivorans]
MIELGIIQKLEIVKITSDGGFLAAQQDNNRESILLSSKELPEEAKVGDEIEVFVYRDSQDEMVATTRKPKITLGRIALLRVVEVTKIGAFLDWGLERDLLLPFKEQTKRVQQGEDYLVGMYIDKSNRLCATMEIYKLLSSESPYKEEDKVHGIIYQIHKELGGFVAVDYQYHGLIPQQELYGGYDAGDEIEARVTKVKEDGKLDLSLREKAYKQMDKDAEVIVNKLKVNNGALALNDNSDPSKIKDELNMSKRAFKRATGRLLKEGIISFTEKGIELMKK